MVLLRSLLIFLLLSVAQLNFAQTTPELLASFAKSYDLEGDSDYKGAIRELENVYSSTSYEINLRLGWLHYLKGQYETSVNYYKVAGTIFPYSEEAKLGLVYPLSAQNKWMEVEKAYLNLLSINPKNTSVLYRLGLIFYYRADYLQAHQYFKTLTDLYPFGYDGLLMYAWTNLQLGKMKEAAILFNKVLLNTPNDASALEGLTFIK